MSTADATADLDLNGRVALVTGAGSGIGRGIANALAFSGATTIFADIEAASAREAALATHLSNATGCTIDVATPSHWQDVMTTIEREHARLDILVNAAGIYRLAQASDMGLQEWTRVIDTNFSSVFFALKYSQPLLRRSDGAHVVNIASTLGLRTRAGVSAYAASKAGVISLTRSAALEFAGQGLKIRVNALCPGPTLTGVINTLSEDELDASGGVEAFKAKVMQTIPLRRWGTVGDITAAALYLISESGSFNTGSCLTIDGGQSA